MVDAGYYFESKCKVQNIMETYKSICNIKQRCYKLMGLVSLNILAKKTVFKPPALLPIMLL